MTIDVFADDLADLRSRLRATRWSAAWPEPEAGQAWDAGVNQQELRRLVAHWADGFDWEAQQRRIAALPWHEADLDGTPLAWLRFDAEPSTDADPLPIVLLNGWPSTALEMVDVAQRLATPSAHGGDPADARTVVVPALPGFPFSPQRPRHAEQTHDLVHRLMTEHVGAARYAAHGGDLGAGIASRLAEAYPEAVAGLHLLAVAGPVDLDPSTLTNAERAYLDEVATWNDDEGGYQHEQESRPLTLAAGLSDSPAGLLAWLLEKYRAWSDGDVATRFTDDEMLTVASLYWFTNSIAPSFRPYWEFNHGFTTRVRRVEVPTAVALFPHDLGHPPREWVERLYALSRYTVMPRGGHFAPHEEPDLLAEDITAFLRTLPAAGLP
ncbi:epoxide hydrolase family protein [Tersicoccus sp. Bi-70]|uniref:epoxide hydrolase family protein n=1 Tax=Tersicoccus sp. Bi-70 TaxID=1897634 RepID=UPI000975EC05|nr:epoxide hydrolase family protein [Tersicoccus sp. Bi-70]OMH37211.1 hydrolase [Tersicoccus sp. Bi-70]